jgi:ketosteroid isomerase-like protein
MDGPDDEPLVANERFYAAARRRDLPAMDALWARHHAATCVHPGWPALHGRGDVMGSWRSIFEGGGAPPLRCRAPVATVHGDVAVVVCEEHLPGAVLVATNVFVREDGRWAMTHHHAGPVMGVRARDDGDDDDAPPTPRGEPN